MKLSKITENLLKNSKQVDTVNKLVEALTGKMPSNLAEALEILKMDMLLNPNSTSVSRGETRPLRQYTSNNYHLSVNFSTDDLFKFILQETLTAEEPIARYLELRAKANQVLLAKMENTMKVLKTRINKFKTNDGLAEDSNG